MIADIIAWVVGLFVDAGIQESTSRRNEGISRGEGRVLGAMRISLGEAPRLSRRWRGVEVQPRPGVIAYELQRLSVLRAFRRTEPLPLREELKVPLVSSPVIIDLHVPGASLEWAVPAQDADWVLEALCPRER